jgi:hypothetical protein
MTITELNTLPAGRVLWRKTLVSTNGREAHAKQVIIKPLSKKDCDACKLPFPSEEKVIRFIVGNRVQETKCLSCFIAKENK